MAVKYPAIPAHLDELEAEIKRVKYMVEAFAKDTPTSDAFMQPTMKILWAQEQEWLRLLIEAKEKMLLANTAESPEVKGKIAQAA